MQLKRPLRLKPFAEPDRENDTVLRKGRLSQVGPKTPSTAAMACFSKVVEDHHSLRDGASSSYGGKWDVPRIFGLISSNYLTPN